MTALVEVHHHVYSQELTACMASPGKNLKGSWIGNHIPEVSSFLGIPFGLPGRETLELLNAAPRRLLSRVWGFELPWRSPHLTAERAAMRDRGTRQTTFHHLIKTRAFDSFCFWHLLRHYLPSSELRQNCKGKKTNAHHRRNERGKDRPQPLTALQCFAKPCASSRTWKSPNTPWAWLDNCQPLAKSNISKQFIQNHCWAWDWNASTLPQNRVWGPQM